MLDVAIGLVLFYALLSMLVTPAMTVLENLARALPGQAPKFLRLQPPKLGEVLEDDPLVKLVIDKLPAAQPALASGDGPQMEAVAAQPTAAERQARSDATLKSLTSAMQALGDRAAPRGLRGAEFNIVARQLTRSVAPAAVPELQHRPTPAAGGGPRMESASPLQAAKDAAAKAAVEGAQDLLEVAMTNALRTIEQQVQKNRQRWSFIVGLALVLTLNADTVLIAQVLWQDDARREAVVAIAQSSDLSDSADVEAINAQLDELPLGWMTAEQAAGKPHAELRTLPDADTAPQVWLTKVLGLLLTSLAMLLGAPFWLGMLDRLLEVRGVLGALTGRKKEQEA